MSQSTPQKNVSDLNIILDHVLERDFAGTGVCFRERPSGMDIDTIIVHSCYVEAGIITSVGGGSIESGSEESALRLRKDWVVACEGALSESDPGRITELASQNDQLKFLAIHNLIAARRGGKGLSPYNKESIKDVFQFHGVSAHYLIDRAGLIFELVPPEKMAFHAGKSRIPVDSDQREAVNDFSIGIELMGNEESGFTDPQYLSIALLTKSLMQQYSIRNVFGHSDIALPLGRKTDPWRFDWERFKRGFGYDPGKHVVP